VCQLCDVNSRYSNTQLTCVCIDGYYGTWNKCYKCDASCKTCTGAGASQCTSCFIGAVSNGVCSNSCGTGQFMDTSNNCQNCLTNCAVCHTTTSCTSCDPGFTRKSTNSGGTTITTCEAPSPTASHVLTLRSHVLGALVIYQGVALSALPQAIVTDSCSSCDTLFEVNTNSLFTTVTVTQQFVPNSQYWFILTFTYSSSTPVPTFEYSIKINPTHVYAQHFTSQDLAQSLTGAFTPDSFPVSQAAPQVINANGFNSGRTGGGGTFPPQLRSNVAPPTGAIPQSVIDQLFA